MTPQLSRSSSLYARVHALGDIPTAHGRAETVNVFAPHRHNTPHYSAGMECPERESLLKGLRLYPPG